MQETLKYKKYQQNGISIDGLQEPVPPGDQLRHVGTDLVHWPVHVLDAGIREPGNLCQSQMVHPSDLGLTLSLGNRRSEMNLLDTSPDSIPCQRVKQHDF